MPPALRRPAEPLPAAGPSDAGVDAAPPGAGVPVALSCTHQHALAVLATELPRLGSEGPVRVLDAGCGDGLLLGYLSQALPAACPGLAVELYGFDVTDHDVQRGGFLDESVRRLRAAAPGTDWADRVRAVRSRNPWPFPDRYFHAVLSNQVLEHVRDHEGFMRQTARVLAGGGFAFHVFPLRSCLWEPHVHLPVAHWIEDHDLLRSYLAAMSRLGLGGYRAHARARGTPVADYAEQHADYLCFLTNYRPRRELFALARAAGLRPSMRYTEQYFLQRWRKLAGLPPAGRYGRVPAALHGPLSRLLPLLASCTLFLEKRQTYRA